MNASSIPIQPLMVRIVSAFPKLEDGFLGEISHSHFSDARTRPSDRDYFMYSYETQKSFALDRTARDPPSNNCHCGHRVIFKMPLSHRPVHNSAAGLETRMLTSRVHLVTVASTSVSVIYFTSYLNYLSLKAPTPPLAPSESSSHGTTLRQD